MPDPCRTVYSYLLQKSLYDYEIEYTNIKTHNDVLK